MHGENIDVSFCIYVYHPRFIYCSSLVKGKWSTQSSETGIWGFVMHWKKPTREKVFYIQQNYLFRTFNSNSFPYILIYLNYTHAERPKKGNGLNMWKLMLSPNIELVGSNDSTNNTRMNSFVHLDHAYYDFLRCFVLSPDKRMSGRKIYFFSLMTSTTATKCYQCEENRSAEVYVSSEFRVLSKPWVNMNVEMKFDSWFITGKHSTLFLSIFHYISYAYVQQMTKFKKKKREKTERGVFCLLTRLWRAKMPRCIWCNWKRNKFVCFRYPFVPFFSKFMCWVPWVTAYQRWLLRFLIQVKRKIINYVKKKSYFGLFCCLLDTKLLQISRTNNS